MDRASAINRLDDLLWECREIFKEHPELLTKYKAEWKKIELAVANTKRVNQLRALWPDVPSQAFLDLDSNQSVPFVTMMIGLTKRHYRVQPMSMFLFWRRMCATGQDNILTYFSWGRFEATFTDTAKMVTANDLLRVCSDNQIFLDNIGKCLADNQSVDYKIRELLGGLSMQSDVRSAWKKWCMTNHPDKGGDQEQFLKVKLVYDEWCEINSQQSTKG